MIAGVCAGLAVYLGVDVSLVRLVWMLVFFVHGAGLLAYLLAWLIIPLEPEGVNLTSPEESSNNIRVDSSEGAGAPTYLSRKLVGGVLVVSGVFFLVETLWPWFWHWYFWPLLLIVGGLVLIFSGGKFDQLK